MVAKRPAYGRASLFVDGTSVSDLEHEDGHGRIVDLRDEAVVAHAIAPEAGAVRRQRLSVGARVCTADEVFPDPRIEPVSSTHLGPELRLLFPVPRADRPPRRRAGRDQREEREVKVVQVDSTRGLRYKAAAPFKCIRSQRMTTAMGR